MPDDIPSILPVPDIPALLIENNLKTLVVADIHIGYEHELLQKGLNLPSQTRILKQRLIEAIRKTEAEELILLGDIKHNIPQLSALETKTLPDFLDLPVPTTIIKGNHDGAIEPLSPWPVVPYILKNKILFSHGHMNPPKEKYEMLVVGHCHPAIEITDELGKHTREKTWIRGVLPDGAGLVIMPSFNHLIKGIPFNNLKFTPPGFLFRRYTHAQLSLQSYLLDGTYLGSIEDIT